MSNNIEIWKPIIGYEGAYEISSFGRVRSLDRITSYVSRTQEGKEYTTTHTHKGKLMKQHNNHFGYKVIALCIDGKYRTYMVHRLVADAFLSNPNNYPVVNHKDENKQNNMVWVNDNGSIDYDKSNLEWCSQQYNINYGSGNLRRINTRNQNKSYHYQREVGQYTLDGVLIKKYPSASDTGYCRECIRDCCNGRQKTAYGYKWAYLN
jgi:hypothetical protein